MALSKLTLTTPLIGDHPHQPSEFATNAVNERSFSALRRVKTFLRSSINQDRLNYLMELHVHKTLIDTLDLIEVANEIVTGSEHRFTMFGKFVPSDVVG